MKITYSFAQWRRTNAVATKVIIHMLYNSSWNMVTHRRLFSLLHSSFIQSIFWLTRDPLSLQRRFLHKVRSSVSCFSFHYPLFSFRSSRICLHFCPRFPVTYIILLFLSMKCFTRQFQGKMWTIQLFFLLFVVCRIFLSPLTFCNTSSFLIRSV